MLYLPRCSLHARVRIDLLATNLDNVQINNKFPGVMNVRLFDTPNDP